MSQWGWSPARNLGIWCYGAGWMRPIMAVIPYVTVGLLLMMLFIVGGTLTTSKGVLFDLPNCSGAVDGEKTDMVALVMPVTHDTMVFFDDTRYLLGDSTSLRNFGMSLAERVERGQRKSLLLLADRRVSTGNLIELVSVARQSGVEKVLVAGRREGGGE